MIEEISKIQTGSGIYPLKDETSRNNISEIQNKIKNIKDYNFQPNLENDIIFDTTGNLQGMCCSEDKLYLCKEGNSINYPIGKIEVIDLINKVHLNTIENVKIYHANDVCYHNNKLYITSTKGETQNEKSKKLIIYNILNNTIIEKNPFTQAELNDYTSLIGVSVYNDNTLLCALTMGQETVTNLIFATYNIDTEDVQILPIINDSNIRTDFYGVFQSCIYQNNKIYVLTSNTNSILVFNIKENNTYLEAIINLPYRDNLGLTIGEFEGISITPSEIYGKNTIMLSSQINNNYEDSQCFQSYLINFDSNTPTYEKAKWLNDGRDERTVTYLAPTNYNNILYENGSIDYPFKNITRAIEYVNYSNVTSSYIIRHVPGAGGTFRLGKVTNKKFNIDGYNVTSDITLIGDNIIEGSDIRIEIENRNIIFNNPVELSNSNLYLHRAIFNNQVKLLYNNKALLNGCISNYTKNNPLVISGSECLCGVTFNETPSTYINIDFNSMLRFPNNNIPIEKVNDSGSNVIIYPGVYKSI